MYYIVLFEIINNNTKIWTTKIIFGKLLIKVTVTLIFDFSYIF